MRVIEEVGAILPVGSRDVVALAVQFVADAGALAVVQKGASHIHDDTDVDRAVRVHAALVADVARRAVARGQPARVLQVPRVRYDPCQDRLALADVGRPDLIPVPVAVATLFSQAHRLFVVAAQRVALLVVLLRPAPIDLVYPRRRASRPGEDVPRCHAILEGGQEVDLHRQVEDALAVDRQAQVRAIPTPEVAVRLDGVRP
mmetsp:Transcript_23765/g.68440  ORF Transcript_23765/g.68440 Transcript_23765/m.68440 type:complete len:202 (-) Transcript_23765:379-984(-)